MGGSMKEFEEIKKLYLEYEKELRRSGKGVVWDTEKGIFGTADCDVVFGFFKKIELDRYKNFLDIGSGDGRVVIIASLFTDATGIEADEELIEVSKKIRKEIKTENKITFLKEDYLMHDLSQYDIIFINPDKEFPEQLDKKLLESNARVFVYNHIFRPNKLKKGKTYWVNEVPVIEFTR
ncbi:MAG: class I SAM-dependent methyltransferase [Nanoarchaeota archaeon]|nr:class I SAM-dependent methyltransferase [Nanoarchaeota archaeon]